MTGLVGSIALGGLFGKAKAIASSIPWWVWAAVAGIALLWLGGCVHGHKVKAFEKQVIAADDAKWQKKLDQAHADALDWKAKFENAQDVINKDIGARNETDVRTHSTVANDQRLSGSGAARCRQGNNSTVPSAASERQPASGASDSTATDVPAEDRAAVPWGWLVTTAQVCDDNRSEVLAWREWHQRQSAIPR